MCIAEGNVKSHSHYGKQYGGSSNYRQNYHVIQLFTFEPIPKKVESRILKKYIYVYIPIFIAVGFPSGSVVKNPPAKQEIQVLYVDQEDPLEKGMVTYSSILAWEILSTEKPGGVQSTGSQRVRHNLVMKPLQPFIAALFTTAIKQK